MENNQANQENNQSNPNNNTEFNKKEFFETFTQYRLTEEAEVDFRGFAKSGADVERDILEKRINVLIHTANSKKELPNNKTRYQFSTFVILTNEEEQTIDVVYWIKYKQKVTKAMVAALKNKYDAVGLDETGFAIKGAE